MKKLVHGVGINDADYTVRTKDGICPFYQKWHSMITRCYSPKLHARRPSYKDCSVCEDWLTFSNFKSWMVKQPYKNNQLDKDIINPGNKLYSPNNCCFISLELNSLLGGRKGTGLSKGVYKQRGKFRSSICLDGSLVHLGVFETEQEASKIYIEKKREYILKISANQKDQRVADGLAKIARLL